MNYSGFVQQISILAQQAISPAYSLGDVPDFQNTIPTIIAYAEGRIYRDCAFLAQRVQNSSSVSASAGNRSLDISSISPPVMVVEGVALITPAATAPAAGTRWNYDMASLDTIDMLWPVEATTVAPAAADLRLAAMKDEKTIVLMPTPDGAYKAEITGLVQPTALSASNTTTYLSNIYSDILVVAAMIFVSGYLRDYGAQSEDPKTGLSWEALYKSQMVGVTAEEQRRRTQGVGWSPNLPTVLANPQRT